MNKGIYLHSCLRLGPSGPKNLLILSINGVLYYFPQFAILQGNARVFGINIDKSKVEMRTRVKHFLAHAFEMFYITIWSCTKLKDVPEVLPMFIPNTFVDQFVFIWGCEQCSKTSSQNFPGFYFI